MFLRVFCPKADPLNQPAGPNHVKLPFDISRSYERKEQYKDAALVNMNILTLQKTYTWRNEEQKKFSRKESTMPAHAVFPPARRLQAHPAEEVV